MPTYSLKAPNGKTYNIEGPEGASEDDVRAEVMRRDPTAAAGALPPAEPKKPATFMSTLGRAAYNLPMDIAENLKGTMQQFGPEGIPAHVIMHPVQSWHDATVTLPDKVASVLAGGAQRVRDMSSPENRGSAPRMDTTEYDKFADENYQKYGTKQNLYRTVGDKPFGTALTVAAIADPALRAAGGYDAAAPVLSALGTGAAKLAEPALTSARTITAAERRAKAAAETMRGEATTTFKGNQAAAEAEAAAATQRAARAAALAERAKAQGRTLTERSSAAAAAATPPVPEIGEARHLSEMGDTIRQPALAAQDELNTSMRAADEKYRTAMEQVAEDRAKAGVGVSDSKLAKVLIKRSQDLVEPDPVKRAAVGGVPADSAGGKLHNMLLNVLRPQEVPLTVEEAKRARARGIEVNTAKDGSFSRTVKPDLKSVDDFRRFLGKVLDGKIEGYEAVNRVEAGQLYSGVSKVIDQYVNDASKPVLENWRQGKAALEPFEKVRAGQAVVGTQGGTDVAAVPAANIPGRVLSGGRDTLQQTAAVAGAGPVKSVLRSQVQNVLSGAKSADEAEALVRPGTKLGDALSADYGLQSAVKEYIGRVRQAETSGTQAQVLSGRADTATERAARLSKMADTLSGNATKATDVARGYQRELAQLEIADPKQVGGYYKSMLDRAHASGQIDTLKYQDGLKLAASAENDFKIKSSRDKWLRAAGYALGVGSVPLGMAGFGSLAAVAGAAGAGAVAMKAGHYLRRH